MPAVSSILTAAPLSFLSVGTDYAMMKCKPLRLEIEWDIIEKAMYKKRMIRHALDEQIRTKAGEIRK